MSTKTEFDWKIACQKILEENLRQCESRLQGNFDSEENRSWWVMQARQICDAIERSEQGTYGQCTICKQPIDRERLLAIPIAELCLDCQTRREKKNNSWAYANSVATGGIL